MAVITVTNLSNQTVLIQEGYVQLAPGGVSTFERFLPDLEKMDDLMKLFIAGTIDISVAPSPEDLRWRNFLGYDEVTRSWAFQSNATTQYAGGFYDFSSSPDDFAPAITFGTAGAGVAAHIAIITGAVTVDEVTVRVTGTSITDAGVQTIGDTDDIVIPAGTAADSYFETKKFQGEVSIETISGTAISCNYGWTKYHDWNNQDFELLGFECLWESDSTDSASDIVLFHHKTTGWTYNGAGVPTPPTPVASRSIDHAGQNDQRVGAGAWKRSGLSVQVHGDTSEGVLFCVTSGNLGVGALSFRIMSLEVSLRKLPLGHLDHP